MIPTLGNPGSLPPGLHAASLREAEARFGGTAKRETQSGLLREVVSAALFYPSIKRVLLWGSFVSNKPEPNDLDYSLVVGVEHKRARLRPEHEPFLLPRLVRLLHGVDPNYFLIEDHDLGRYAMLMDFIFADREGKYHGIIEINLRGERTYEEVHD